MGENRIDQLYTPKDPVQFQLSSLPACTDNSDWLAIRNQNNLPLIDAGTLPTFSDWPQVGALPDDRRPVPDRAPKPSENAAAPKEKSDWYNYNDLLFKPEPEPSIGKSLFGLAIEHAQTELLKQAVAQVLKDFGSEDFAVREAAEKRAKTLGLKAIPLLKEGLTSDIPDVRLGADLAIRQIRGAALKKCLDPVEALNDGLTSMCVAPKLTDEMRKRFDEKIQMADALTVTQEELDTASDLITLPEPGEPGFMKALDRKYQLRDAHNLKSDIRLFYASQLLSTGNQEDSDRAKQLLTEAVKMPGWQNAPGLIVNCVDKLRIPLKELPQDVQTAYQASLAQIKRYNQNNRIPSHSLPDSRLPDGWLVKPD